MGVLSDECKLSHAAAVSPVVSRVRSIGHRHTPVSNMSSAASISRDIVPKFRNDSGAIVSCESMF